ncbi:hypothetical protein NDU88_003814 [Pleurodeles waltl]|uniref:Uncharacterized protein n=1 Tax=Pleurodeles waltl TaxID=8319 RepID=A0AAV7MWN9_PLEWA|nr:hypothetical protein NDU88_003814 [Pleurodeles waltl]
MSSPLSPTDYDSLEIQQQYNDINNRWELTDEDWDNENSSARLFERSRIKALAGEYHLRDRGQCKGARYNSYGLRPIDNCRAKEQG